MYIAPSAVVESKIDFELFPNPTMGSFNLTFNDVINHEVEIYDNAGRIIERMVGQKGMSLFDIKKSQPATEDGVPLGLNSNNLPNAWILQVGSFIDARKSTELQKKLVSAGYKAFGEKIKIADQYHHRVYIGPKLDRSRALEIKVKIDAKFDTDSIVLSYEP